MYVAPRAAGSARRSPLLGCSLPLAFLLLAIASRPAPAAISVQGVSNRKVYADRASFRVVARAGYDDTVLLNGVEVASGETVEVTRPQYYRLEIERRNQSSGAKETLEVQFIVKASERGNSEWGLPPWVPYPPIDSAPAEFAGATLRLTTPAAIPAGLEIPVIARVEDAAGARVGVNGLVRAAGFSDQPLRLLRGVGSVFLPAATAGQTLSYAGEVGGLSTTKTIAVDTTTSWTTARGTLSGSPDWGEDARVRVSGDLTVPAGSTLTIGAGSVVVLGPGVDVVVNGHLVISGTLERPVLFTAQDRARGWGGFDLNASTSRATVTGAIFTASGADASWFSTHSGRGGSHRKEQPCFYVGSGARADLTDCALVENHGQAGHGQGGTINLTRCLIQRCITSGQYNDGSIRLTDCALIEFPAFDAPFSDDDNDALYMTGGSHFITDTLIGWALDDGADAGSGSAGPVRVSGCWFESCFHEGMAWSEDRLPTVRDTVAINCGQGIECGFGGPDVDAARCLSTANLVGARFGDNYDWSYSGTLLVTDSLLLHNWRDIWGRNWDDWKVRLAQMDLHGNLLTAADPLFPANSVWDPATDAARLDPFLPAPAAEVGIGIATWRDQLDTTVIGDGTPVRLSTFTPHPVTVDWVIDSDAGPLGAGTLEFSAGETVEVVPAPDLGASAASSITVRISSPTGGVITGRSEVSYVRRDPVTVVAAGSTWKYFDNGSNPGSTWRRADFDDSGWRSGPAELGYGDGDEATVVASGPSGKHRPAVFFRRAFDVADPAELSDLTLRLKRDDGAIVWLNGTEVMRSNMPAGPVAYNAWADGTTSSEGSFRSAPLDPARLLAGRNVLAVEVHQASATSSDLSFDLELAGFRAPVVPAGGLLRGDANGDGAVDISDAVKILTYLFLGSGTDCEDALDADDSGTLDITDAIYLLRFLFLGQSAPPAPFPVRGTDPTDTDPLGCERA